MTKDIFIGYMLFAMTMLGIGFAWYEFGYFSTGKALLVAFMWFSFMATLVTIYNACGEDEA